MNVEIKVTRPHKNLWHVLTDAERNRRNRFSYPMVYWWKEESMPISKEWQLYLCAMNYGMELRYVSALLGNSKAFCNGTGFGDDDERQNWILQTNLDSRILPAFSKCFTCGGATVEIVDGVVTMMDGSRNPELRSDLFYPLTRQQALDPASYKYLPETHPHLFFACVNVNDDFTPTPFPNGALYSWYGTTPVSFLPHVAKSRMDYPVPSTALNAAVCSRL